MKRDTHQKPSAKTHSRMTRLPGWTDSLTPLRQPREAALDAIAGHFLRRRNVPMAHVQLAIAKLLSWSRRALINM